MTTPTNSTAAAAAAAASSRLIHNGTLMKRVEKMAQAANVDLNEATLTAIVNLLEDGVPSDVIVTLLVSLGK